MNFKEQLRRDTLMHIKLARLDALPMSFPVYCGGRLRTITVTVRRVDDVYSITARSVLLDHTYYKVTHPNLDSAYELFADWFISL